MNIKEFAESQMKQFSTYDCERSLPHVIDGMKITQRKIIKTMLNGRENTKEIKVAQLASYVAAETDYHHGEAGIGNVAIGMATDYPGSNNINLLNPIGQFGSQLDPTPAATRYIFTSLSDNFKKVFNKEDYNIVVRQYSDDLEIEPAYFIPLIPLVLINGSSGIGTGFASKIFNRDAKDVIDHMLKKLNGVSPRKRILPSYNNWKGDVEISTESDKQFYFKGKLERIGANKIKISELPIGMTQEKISSIIVDLMETGVVTDFDDDSSETDGINITVYAPRTTVSKTEDDLLKLFKLISKDSENITCWLPENKLKVFSSVEQVCDYFIEFRLAKYEERRLNQINSYGVDLSWAEEKKKFIEYYLINAALLSKMNKEVMFNHLKDQGFIQVDRLLQIRIYNLAKDEIDKLKDEIKLIKQKIKDLKSTTAKEMYIEELTVLSKTI